MAKLFCGIMGSILSTIWGKKIKTRFQKVVIKLWTATASLYQEMEMIFLRNIHFGVDKFIYGVYTKEIKKKE